MLLSSAQGVKVLVLAFLLIGVVPLLIGVLFEQVLVIPIRVPLDQSPVFFLWQVCLYLLYWAGLLIF